jgi:hypothetical protein
VAVLFVTPPIHLPAIFLACNSQSETVPLSFSGQAEVTVTEPTIPDKIFTLEELRIYDGSEPSLPIFLAIKV